MTAAAIAASTAAPMLQAARVVPLVIWPSAPATAAARSSVFRTTTVCLVGPPVLGSSGLVEGQSDADAQRGV